MRLIQFNKLKKSMYFFTVLFCVLTIVPFEIAAGILNSETGRLQLPYGTRFKMHINGNTAYIGAYSTGELCVVDIFNKSTPYFLSKSFIAGQSIHDIWYSNNYVYFAHRFGGVTKIDVSNGSAPVVYPFCMMTNYTHNGIQTSINPTLQTEVLYVADHQATVPFRVFNPVTNQQIASFPNITDGREIVVTSDGKYLFQATWGSSPSINIYDVRNLASITLVNRIGIYADEMVISPDNKYLYLTYDSPADDKTEGVMIMNISSPASAYIERMIPLPGARELTVDHAGKRLFVRTRSDMALNPVPTGIYAFDINTLGSEWQIDFLPTTADREDFDIWYDNEYLYYTDNKDAGSQLVLLHVGVANHNRPPLVTNVNITINEDGYSNINFNAHDQESAPLTYTISQEPQNGHVLGTFPNVYYYPNSNFNGTDQFKCMVSDGEMSTEANAIITVLPVNDPPIISAIPDQSVAEGSLLEFYVYAMDIENDPITLTASALPSGSTFVNGVFRWTPNLQQAGEYYAQFIASDSKIASSCTVRIKVTNTNQAPVANAQNVTTSEDYGKSIYLSGSDPDGQSINYLIVTQPVNGTLSGTPPSLLYKPNANYNGVDVFTFKVSDGSLNSPEAAVSITVNAVNDLPVLTSPITWQVDENAPLTFVATGSDVDGDAVTFSAENLPSGATFVNNTFSWTPNFNQAGDHYFSILISDGKVTIRYSVKITVNNVNRSPVANAQSIITDEDNTKSIVLSGSDPDGGTVTYTVITQPANGTLSGNAPDLTFTPNANFNGSDAFAYRVSDGVLSAEATVSITVNSVNDAPVLNSILPQTVNENALLTFATTGSDIDGDALSYSATNLPSGATLNTNGTFSWTPTYEQSGNYTVTISVSDGNSSVSQNVTIIVNNVNRKPVANAKSITTNEDNAVALILTGSDPDGEELTYTVIAGPSKGTLSGTPPNLTYTPNTNYNGSDVITFNVTDGDLSDQATVAITVNSVNDAPVLNAIAAQSVEENSSLTFTATGSDIDKDALTFSAVNLPSGASFNNGTFTWNPTFEQAGRYTVTVSVSDENETVSQEVVITVTNLNRAPTADAQSVTTNEDKSIAITLSGNDPDGEELTYTVVSGPTHGTLTGTAPNLTFVPNANFNGSDVITFSVSDGSLSAEATVEIAVNAVNDAPVLNAIAAQSVEENASLTFTATGSDIDQDALTFSAVNLPSGASFNNGTFTWNPTFEQAGRYTVTVSVSDENETVSQEVVITVTNLNRGPSADAQSVTTNEDKSIAITLSGNDPDGEELNYTVVSGPTHGTLTGTAPNLTFVPNANFNGSDAITFSVSDGNLNAEATVEIAINAVNDAPVLNAIAAQSVEENSSLTFTATGSDIDQDALTFSAVNLPSGASFNNGTFTWNPTFEQAGRYTVTVSVSDENETVSQEVVITVANLNRAPTADAQSVTTNEDKSTAINLSGSDPDGEELTYTVVSGPSKGTLTGTAPNLTFVPNANFNGSDAITFSVSDGSLSAEATIEIAVNAVNDAPVLNAIAAQSVEENSSLTFTATGSDIDQDALTFGAANLPSGASFNNGTFTWDPTFEQAGTYTVTVSVTDENETVSQEVVITVTNLNRGPSADVQSVTTNEDKSVPITLSGIDPDKDVLTYLITTGPSHGTLTGAAPNITYVPNANFNGTDAITFSASDGSLIATATITISVFAVNDAPVLNPIQPQSIDENAVLSFTTVASDIDGDILTLSASNLPTGSTFKNGTFSWLPTFEQAGLYTITVTATDGKLTVSRVVSITVNNKAVKAKIYMYDEAMSNPSGSNPRLYVVNTSNEIIHGCRIEYYFTADNGKIPQLDLYYTANVKVTLASRGNGDYTIVYDLSGIDIAPGAIFPNTGGLVVGISYKDWSTVDKTNDYSNNLAKSYVENNKICVYDNSNWLLGGLKPANTTILPFAVAGNDVWTTVARVTLNASKSYDLFSNITSYEWIINGTVVSTDIAPTLTFNNGVTTVTLKVTNANGVSSTDEVKVNVLKDTEVLFSAGSEPISQNAPYTIEYYVPAKMTGCVINLMASNAWGSSNIVTVSGTAGYHSENIYAWTKSALGGSGPWSVKCKVNGTVTQTLSIKFNY